MRREKAIVIALLFVCGAAPAALAQASDVVTIGSATVIGSQAIVPVYIRDVSGTPLGIDQPAGSRIQSYSIKVDYSPAAAITAVTFVRAGIAAGLTPTFESSPAAAGSISLLDTFPESTTLIPFTSNKAAPGDLVGLLFVTVAYGTPAGTVINLTLDPTLTQLTDQGGVTKETVGNATLTLVSGSVTLGADVPAFDWRVLALLGALLVVVGIRAAS